MTHYKGNHPSLDTTTDPTKPTGSFKAPKTPAGPYARDKQSGENPEVDDITEGDEAQKRRDKMQRQEKAEGDR